MIAVVGSNMVDLITYINRMPNPGETLEAPDFQMGCGGKGANQAVAAARLGAEVLMVTRVGNDNFAKNTRENFEANGISTQFVLETETTSGVAPIFVEKSSQNSILIVQGANAHLSPKDVDAAREEIAKCSLIVMQLEIPLETVYYTIELANELGIPVILNPAPANPELDLYRIASCEYFLPNESELGLITGMPVETLEQIEEAAQLLVEKGIKNVIVTLGEKGVLCLSAKNKTVLPAFNVDAVDTTGAGDAFIGCFAQSLDAGFGLEDSVKRATFYASDSVTKRGTQYSYATAEEISFP